MVHYLSLFCMGILFGGCGQEQTEIPKESVATEVVETVDLSGAAGIADDTEQQEGNGNSCEPGRKCGAA